MTKLTPQLRKRVIQLLSGNELNPEMKEIVETLFHDVNTLQEQVDHLHGVCNNLSKIIAKEEVKK